MKTLIALLVVVGLISGVGCRSDEIVTPPSRQPYLPSYAEPGPIVVQFVDTVTESTAEQFFLGWGFSDYRIYSVEDVQYGSIKVPFGEETQWIGRFKGSPLVKDAFQVFVMVQA